MEADEEEEDSDEINVQSENFNALHALYSSKIVVPFPSAPVLDNVAKATSLLSRNQDLVNKPVQRVKKEVEASTSSSEPVKTTAAAAAAGGTRGAFPPTKNVLTRMNEARGPLAFLKACMEKRIRVKVWTRTARGIRGYCLGFVVAFDKHWNLVLEDVLEVWTRRVKRKKYHLGEANEMPLAWKAMGPAVKPPEVVVTKLGPGTATCERHVKQMLMRGKAKAENRGEVERGEKKAAQGENEGVLGKEKDKGREMLTVVVQFGRNEKKKKKKKKNTTTFSIIK